MLLPAALAGVEQDFEAEEVEDLANMSKEVVEKSYAYGNVGMRLQKRIPLK